MPRFPFHGHRASLSLLLGSCCLFFLATSPRPALADLPPPQLAALNQEVAPAYHAGNPVRLITALSPLVQRWDVAGIEAADRHLTELGLPSVAELLSEARWKLLVQNEQRLAPAAKGRELELTLTGFKRNLESFLNSRSRHVAFDPGAEVPKDFASFERRVWDHHVLENELAAAGRVALFSRSLVDHPSDRRGTGLTADVQQVFHADFDQLIGELERMQRELELGTLRLRLARLEYAVHVLKNVTELKERFQAAHVVDVDGDLVVETLDRASTVGGAQVDPAFRERVVQLRDDGRAAAGADLIAKSNALFTGLHWWYRGRYGQGPEAGGLLKSQQALATPEGQFGLYMPIVPPNPVDDLRQNSQTSLVPRRHFFLWQFETRDLQVASQSYRRTHKSDQVTSITHLQHFY